MTPPPFVIYALPRSRTAWLAGFLSYGEWACFHEPSTSFYNAMCLDGFLQRPRVGLSDSGLTPYWRLIRHYSPCSRSVVILRPVDDVIASAQAVEALRVPAACLPAMRTRLQGYERSLQELSDVRGTLTLDYADLVRADACASVFEWCLGLPFDRMWWEAMKDVNVQADARHVAAHYRRNARSIETFHTLCKLKQQEITSWKAGRMITTLCS